MSVPHPTPQPEITVFHNGPIFRGNAARSGATALAVRDGVVVALGGDQEIDKYIKDAHNVVDLDGRLLLPGFVDAHAHPLEGGVERIRCDLTQKVTPAHYFRAIGDYAVSNPDQEWILGGGWSMEAFERGCPTREQLDSIVGDRPVFLPNRDHHSTWVNSRALELAGVTALTPDPVDGRIERHADGTPSGTLHEGAAELVGRFIPKDSQADLDAGLRAGLRHLHSLGVVAWQDACVRTDLSGPSVHETYIRAESEGWLTARVSGALWWEYDCALDGIQEQVLQLLRMRDEAARAGTRYRVDTVKIGQDGVAETFTAAMLEPYLDADGRVTNNAGISFLEPPLLNAVTKALDAVGFQIHFHALGDRAVREVLDALEQANAANGTSDHRHQLAHLQVIHPDDIPRFRRVGALANLQPLWATHEQQMDELTLPFMSSERAGWQWVVTGLSAARIRSKASTWP
jgi:predicted amidohydrolase YtcJ